jgi:hypothetical protein
MSAPTPTPTRPARRSRGLLLCSTLACLLAVAAAVVSFANGSWLGVEWILLAAPASNMAWYYARRVRAGRAAGDT